MGTYEKNLNSTFGAISPWILRKLAMLLYKVLLGNGFNCAPWILGVLLASCSGSHVRSWGRIGPKAPDPHPN